MLFSTRLFSLFLFLNQSEHLCNPPLCCAREDSNHSFSARFLFPPLIHEVQLFLELLVFRSELRLLFINFMTSMGGILLRFSAAKEVIVRTGSLDYAKNEARELSTRAKKILSGATLDRNTLTFFQGFAEFVIKRSY